MALIFNTSKKDLQKAVELLKQGKVIIYPTETSYGIGCLASFPDSISRIYEIKKRDKNKALIVLADSLQTIKKYAEINKEAQILVKKFMPGPLTLIVQGNEKIPVVLSKTKTIAFRISSNHVAFGLCKQTKKLLVSTSANLEGRSEIYTEKELLAEFSEKVDAIILSGDLPKNPVSTIYDTMQKKVLRNGIVKKSEILHVLNNKFK
ncbi:MAG: L-threonylcarbamoyladenylate synthase [Candidatus Diapherotrites archaeon]|nr:L-threonylcarbamoyladenylate synthase [Candidatus Diapherotrites archaeon]